MSMNLDTAIDARELAPLKPPQFESTLNLDIATDAQDLAPLKLSQGRVTVNHNTAIDARELAPLKPKPRKSKKVSKSKKIPILSSDYTYLSPEEYSEIVKVTPQIVCAMCRAGGIEGAFKFGRLWKIPYKTVEDSVVKTRNS